MKSLNQFAQHTPGPWRARGYRADGKAGNAQRGSIWIDCAYTGRFAGGTVAEVYANGTGNSDPAVQDANANLIAAAPELLSALEALAKIRPCNWDDEDDPGQVRAWTLLDSAIAKATGK